MKKQIQIAKIKESERPVSQEDVVAIEEPLEIQLMHLQSGKPEVFPLSVTMRTPGQDRELAIGFLFTEGIIRSFSDLSEKVSTQVSENNIIVHLSEHCAFDPAQLKRNFYTSSSCGVCGKESIAAIEQVCPLKPMEQVVEIQTNRLWELPARLREVQQTFRSTGGIHAAAFFNKAGELLMHREDVGRHNALDKLIGAEMLQSKKDFHAGKYLLLLSGRASFELIQKAAMAGVQIVCAIGAPSSLAVETAEAFDMTLIGFLKNQSANVYCGKNRII